MLSEYASQWKNTVRSRLGAVRVGPRRAASNWAHSSEINLQQPQDGAFDQDVRSRVSEIPVSPVKAGFQEPEDARLTGSTRSLMRRVMGLNVGKRPVTTTALAVRRHLLSTDEAQVA